MSKVQKSTVWFVPFSVFPKNTSGHHAMAFFLIHCLSHKVK